MNHLWEVDHPYYMTEGNYFQANCHRRFETLDVFLGEFADADMDWNWIVRWDWLEGEDWGAGEFRGDIYYRNGRLMLQMIGQRKALLQSFEVSVCRADEPRVIEYLRPRFFYMMRMWEPFAPEAGTPAAEHLAEPGARNTAQADDVKD